MNYITVDGGTTNTRISLVCDRRLTGKIAVPLGAGSRDIPALKKEIKKGIEKLLSDNGLTEGDIEKILASGMITSEYGLCNLEHITAPAGIQELHDNMYETVIGDISSVPFAFIRGVKTVSDKIEDTDIMRGEETELFGVTESDSRHCMYVLPGSHSKLIETDKNGRIIRFCTMLTGEMAAALSQNTILKYAVDFSVDKADDEYVLRGYEYCRENGINEALFKVRILKNVFECNAEQLYSFFMGIILCGEVQKIISSNAERVIIGGRKQIRNILALILRKVCTDKEIICLSDEAVEKSTAIGAVKIYEL